MGPWMTKAETALRTGQPRLAELYMRRGLSESRAGRSWLARRDFVEALESTGRVMRDLFAEFGFPPAITRDQVALVGPSLGSAGVLP